MTLAFAASPAHALVRVWDRLPADLPATLLEAAVRSVRGIPAADGLAR